MRSLVFLMLAFTVASGPAAASGATDDPACVELSRAIGALVARDHQLQGSFWADPRNRVAAVTATSFTPFAYPALAYLGVRGAQALAEQPRSRAEIRARIAELRARAAERLCFVR